MDLRNKWFVKQLSTQQFSGGHFTAEKRGHFAVEWWGHLRAELVGHYPRILHQPHIEEFFTSIANRKRLEDIFLHRGITILNSANVSKPNIRALGYSLPTHKNFGFGALCFTWRNVANNCPIVFWYSGGGFIPLFVKHQT